MRGSELAQQRLVKMQALVAELNELTQKVTAANSQAELSQLGMNVRRKLLAITRQFASERGLLEKLKFKLKLRIDDLLSTLKAAFPFVYKEERHIAGLIKAKHPDAGTSLMNVYLRMKEAVPMAASFYEIQNANFKI